MDIAKGLALFFQIIVTVLAVLSYFSIRSDKLPFLQPFLSVPWYFYVIALLILIIFFLTWKEKKTGRLTRIVAVCRDLIDIGEIKYKGVKWVVRAPKPIKFEMELEYMERIANDIVVNIPPKCPNCGVELEQSKGWIYGYIWRCIDCGFSKKNKESYYTEAKRAEKLYKRDLEVRINSKHD